MVLELARHGAFDRPVPRVVDARGELVREKPSPHLEELEREHADVAEVVEKSAEELLGLRLGRVGGWSARDAEDAVPVRVLRDRPEARFAVAAPNADDRELSVECDELLGQLVLAHLLGRVDASLPLAVVAESSGLHDRREARVRRASRIGPSESRAA